MFFQIGIHNRRIGLTVSKTGHTVLLHKSSVNSWNGFQWKSSPTSITIAPSSIFPSSLLSPGILCPRTAVWCTSDSSTTYHVQLQSTLHPGVYFPVMKRIQPDLDVLSCYWGLESNRSGPAVIDVAPDVREKQRTLKIAIIKEVPLHCVFPEQHDSRRKWKWGSCASTGHFCQITQAQAGDPVLPEYSLQDNSTATAHVSDEYRFQDTTNCPTASRDTRATSRGDHCDAGLKSSCVPSP